MDTKEQRPRPTEEELKVMRERSAAACKRLTEMERSYYEGRGPYVRPTSTEYPSTSLIQIFLPGIF